MSVDCAQRFRYFSEDFLRIFSGLAQDLLRNIKTLSQGFFMSFSGLFQSFSRLSQDFPRSFSFSKLSEEFPMSFSWLPKDFS